jgi:hypothetical protein
MCIRRHRYILLLIVFSILAMNLFGTVSRGSYLHDRAHFETFGWSMLTLFRAASSDDWNELSCPLRSIVAPHRFFQLCPWLWVHCMVL